MIAAGIDAGSRAIKVVLLDAGSREVLASGVTDQGIQQRALALDLFVGLLESIGRGRHEVGRAVATGYARNTVCTAETTITEITCHAAGVRHLMPGTATIVEIGGQDSKLIHLTPGGIVRDFAMNDRCAAGTGRFLEIVADRLQVRIEDLGIMAARSKDPSPISSTCVVFAETEIIGLLAAGTEPEDIVAGIQSAVASRLVAMAGRGVQAPVVFTGGVAMIPGMRSALAAALRQDVTIAPDPQMTGALGAALLAAGQCSDGP